MANQTRWVKNLYGPHITGPLIVPGLFQAGATQAVERGELLELTADTNTRWTPMDSDYAMAENVAIAGEEIKSGDLAGYYSIIVPRPGDVFEFALAASAGSAIGTDLYWSDSETLTTTAGTNIVGNIAGWTNYPYPQGHLADDASLDKGETIAPISRAQITIQTTNSYYLAIQGA